MGHLFRKNKLYKWFDRSSLELIYEPSDPIHDELVFKAMPALKVQCVLAVRQYALGRNLHELFSEAEYRLWFLDDLDRLSKESDQHSGDYQ